MVRQLQRNETLVYFDMPQLFYASDPIGLDYRCLLVSTDEKEDTYLCTPISLPRLKQFLYGFLDLRIVFENPETQDFSLVRLVAISIQLRYFLS